VRQNTQPFSAQVPRQRSVRGMLRIGKHRGASFEAVAQQDRNYCAWIFRERPSGFKRVHKYLVENHGGVINVGKYKGKFFDEVLHDTPDALGVNTRRRSGSLQGLLRLATDPSSEGRGGAPYEENSEGRRQRELQDLLCASH